MAHYPEGSSTKRTAAERVTQGEKRAPAALRVLGGTNPKGASGKLELYGQSADSKGKAHVGLTRWRPPPSTEMRRGAPARLLEGKTSHAIVWKRAAEAGRYHQHTPF